MIRRYLGKAGLGAFSVFAAFGLVRILINGHQSVLLAYLFALLIAGLIGAAIMDFLHAFRVKHNPPRKYDAGHLYRTAEPEGSDEVLVHADEVCMHPQCQVERLFTPR